MTKETELTTLRAAILETEIELDRCILEKRSRGQLLDRHYSQLKRYFERTTTPRDIVDAEITEPKITDVGGQPAHVPSNFGPPINWQELKKEQAEDWQRATAGLKDMQWRTPDAVDHPKHYNAGKFEVIDVIDDWKLGFAEGNAVKYIARAKHKNNELEDLKKARWYLDHAIKLLEPGVPVAEMVDRPVVTRQPKIAPVSPGEMICQLRITTNRTWEDLPKGTDWGEVIAGRQALRESVEIPLLAKYFQTSLAFWIAIRDNFNVYLKSIGRPPLGTEST
jgi:hypothetical protein